MCLKKRNHYSAKVISEAILAIIDDIAELMRETCDELEEILGLAKTETSHQIEY